jgi:DNA polymerase-1
MSTGIEIVFDTESDGFRDEATVLWCIVALDINTKDSRSCSYLVNNASPDLHHRYLLDYLDKADHLIGHNIIDHDFPLMERLYGWRPRAGVKITDTLTKSRLLRSDRPLPPGCPGNLTPHSLGAWGYRVGRGKPDHSDWTQFSPEMLHRCREDTEINALVHTVLNAEEKSNPRIDWSQSLEIEHAVAPIITEQELNGCPLDLPLVWSTRVELKNKVLEIDREVVPLIPEVNLPKGKQATWPTKQYKKNGEPTVQAVKYYGEDFGEAKEYRTDLVIRTAPINLNSDKQVKEYLLGIGWVPTEWNFKKGKDGKPLRDMRGNRIRTSPRLTLDSLESCKFPPEHADMGEQIVKRLMLAHRTTILTGWLRDCKANGRIMAKAVPMGTPTGRMTHRQVVNVPGNGSAYGTELRSCLTSDPGYTRVGVDLKSCQIYGLSHYMRDEEYRYQVVEGDHHQYAADLAGLSTRQDGKKLNYSILFGASDEKLAQDLGITKEQAAQVRKAYFQGLPKLDALLKLLINEWKQYGYILGLDGRAVWVRAQHMLLVYLLQALESIVMKTFIIGLYRDAKAAGLDFKLVTTMHDECQWLVRDEHVQLFCKIARATIAAVNARFDLWCPQDIDINLGTTWAECH